MTYAGWLSDFRYSLRHPLVRLGLWVNAGVLTLSLVVLAMWWPARIDEQRLNDEIAAKRRELVQAQQADELLRVYARTGKEVSALEKKLERTSTQSQLVESLARLSRKYGVKIVTETYDEARASNAQPMLSVELAVQGSYPALRGFVGDLATLPSWTEVQEVRLEGERTTGMLKGRIRVVTYRRASSERPKSP